MARLRYPRQREYPQPPPPSKNNTRITISMVVIVHLFFAVQCNADWEPKLNVRTTRSKPEPLASVRCRVCLLRGKKCCSARHLLAEVGMREMQLRTRDWEVAGWHAVPPTSMVVRRPVPSPLRSFSTKAVCTHRLVFSVRDVDVLASFPLDGAILIYRCKPLKLDPL